MDDIRAQLDALMGPNRDKKEKESSGAQPEWADSKVCKNFLVGFCCHDWFQAPKRKVQACTKIHSDILKEKFEGSREAAPYRAEWEEDFLLYLEKVAQECDRFIAVEKTKCRPAMSGKATGMPPEIKERCNELEKRYSDLLSKAEDTAQKEYLAKAEMVKEELDTLRSKYVSDFGGEDVCEVCGVRYPLGGSGAGSWHDKESHKKGKIHQGYAQIREKIVELKGKRREWEKHRDAIKSNRRIREREEERQRDKEEKERRQREKEKKKQEEEERQREREREKEREKERQKEREREKEREKEKGRGRSRGRGRSHSESSEGRGRRRKPSREGDRSEEDRGAKRKAGGRSAERSRSRKKEVAVRGRAKSNSGEGSSDRSASGSPGGKSGCSVEEEDIPDFWEMVQSKPQQSRNEFVAALTSSSQERLERWLVARIAGKP